MDKEQLKNIIEAILLAAGRPLRTLDLSPDEFAKRLWLM